MKSGDRVRIVGNKESLFFGECGSILSIGAIYLVKLDNSDNNMCFAEEEIELVETENKCVIKLYSGTTGGEDLAYVYAKSEEEAYEYFLKSGYFKGRELTLKHVVEAEIKIGEVFGEYY